MPNHSDMNEVKARLDAVLRIILDFQRNNSETKVGDQILQLWDSGLSQADACRIIGVNPDQAVSYLKRADNQSLLLRLKKRDKNRR